MKQVNLLRVEQPVAVEREVHLFWKRYFVCLAGLCLAAVAVSWGFAYQVEHVQERLGHAQVQRSALEAGVQRFEARIEEQKQLHEELQSLSDGSQTALNEIVRSKAGVMEILYHIVRSLPDKIDVHSIASDQNRHTLVIEGTANQRNEVFEFVHDGMGKTGVFPDVEIEQLENIAAANRVRFLIKSNLRAE